MSWIERLQKKPQKQKIKIVWWAMVIAAVILIGLWIYIGNVQPSAEKNLDLFKTVDQGVKNFHIDKQQ